MTGGFLNRFLRGGFLPTLNQSEHGAPQESASGQGMQRASGAILGHPTILAGPFHFLDQVGFQPIGNYVTIPVVMPKTSFGGEVSLDQQPTLERGKPWTRSGTLRNE
jgi:hypothetical protein